MSKVIPEYNFNRLSDEQLNVLGLCAINQDKGHDPTVIASLKKLGMLITRGGFHEVPIPAHIAWCAWYSRNYDENGQRKRQRV